MNRKNESEKNKHGKLYYSFPAISMVPLLLYGIVVIIFSSTSFKHSMQEQVYEELKNAACLADMLLDTTYPGDYSLVNGTTPSLYKGDVNITEDYMLIDGIRERTDMDVTLFYQDTRILTTIRNWEGERIVGTLAPEQVLTDVLRDGKSCFYDDVIIRDTTYFAYYAPLRNDDGQIAGILFVGKPAMEVNGLVSRALSPIVIVGVVALVLACLFSLYYAGTFLKALYGLKSFFAQVATGNLNKQLDPAVLKREDELSELASSALSMQHSLRNLVERDTLTELYNRRSGGHHLAASAERARTSNTPFTLVIGDIDLFKRVNDTYGHQCGDLVLQNVSRILRRHIQDKGYAIRWGGEEFLLVYENSTLEEARRSLEALLDEIRGASIASEGNQVYVTMTFGMACDPSKELKELLREADDRLYYGKNNGRNQIVADIPAEN
ncbi:MAG: diguanylate cyclase [bacterium]|nr:diguanylate cyclase [bacterium]MCM1376330.1 diguanylate cyclase [Muribaculum sp.]